MAQQTVEVVRNAEKQAEQTEKEAAAREQTILIKARENAKATVVQMTAAAKQYAQQQLEEATRQGNQNLVQALESAKQEVASLKAEADKKKEEAITLVLSQLIN